MIGAGWKVEHPATSPDAMTMHFIGNARTTSFIVLGLLAPACDLGPKSIGGDPIAETGDEAEGGSSEGDTGDTGEGDTGDTGDTGEGATEESGDETGVTDPVVGACGAETESIITDLDSIPPGFAVSVAQMIEQSTTVYHGTFDWSANDGPAMVAHAGTSASFELFVDYIGGEIVLVEVADVGSFPDGDGGEPCSNRLEIPTRTEFMTDDGLFDEVFEVPLIVESHASDPNPRFYFPLDFTSFGGTLAMSDFAFQDGVVDAVIFMASFPSGAVTGSLGMEVTVMDFVGFGFIASFEGVADAP